MRPFPKKSFVQVQVAISDLLSQLENGRLAKRDFKHRARDVIEKSGWEIEEFKRAWSSAKTSISLGQSLATQVRHGFGTEGVPT